MSSNISVVVDQVSPVDVQVKVEQFKKIVGFLKLLGNDKVDLIVDFVDKVASKPAVYDLVAAVINLYNSDWKNDVDVLVTKLKA